MRRFVPLLLTPLLLAAVPVPALPAYDPALPGAVAIATTAEGRKVWLASFTRPGRLRPKLLLLFGQHPDEHDATMLGLALVKRLAEAPASDKACEDLRAAADVMIVPMMNPDGTEYDRTSAAPATWRKNRRKLSGGAIGVNLNRNWDADFAGPDTSTDPASAQYPGEAPFSEAETRAVRDLIRDRKPDVVVDYHTGESSLNQGIVMYPESSDAPAGPRLAGDRLVAYQRAATAFAAALTDATDKRPGYVAMRSPAIGDWVRARIRGLVPPKHLAQALASVPARTGASGAGIDWACRATSTLALAVEASRPSTPPTAEGFAALAAADAARRIDLDLRALTILTGHAAPARD